MGDSLPKKGLVRKQSINMKRICIAGNLNKTGNIIFSYFFCIDAF